MFALLDLLALVVFMPPCISVLFCAPQVIRMVGESQEQLVGAGAGGGAGSNKTPTLEEYGTNLTTQANEVRDL